MPMMQSYIKAGDFTVRGKLKSALIDNAIYYGSYLFICGILLIYLALKPGIHLDGYLLLIIEYLNKIILFVGLFVGNKSKRLHLPQVTLGVCFCWCCCLVTRSLKSPGICGIARNRDMF